MENAKDKSNKKAPIRRRLIWLFLILFVLLPALILLLLQLPFFQNIAIDYFSEKLSKQLDAEVSIGQVDIDFRNGIMAEDVYIINPMTNDTLLSTGLLSTSLSENLLYLFKNKLSVNKLVLKDAKVLIKTSAGDKESYLAKILKKFSNPDAEPKSDNEPLALSLKEMDLENIAFTKVNENSGSIENYKLGKALINIDELNLDEKRFHFNKIELDSPESYLNLFAEIIESENIDKNEDDQKEKSAYSLKIKDLIITNGKFYYVDESNFQSRYSGFDHFDPNNFQVDDLTLLAHDIVVNDSIGAEAAMEKMILELNNNYQIRDISGDFVFNDRILSIGDFNFETNNSKINESIKLKYRNKEAFSDFVNRVIIDANLRDSYVAIDDISYFMPQLHDAKFFISNKGKKISIDGRLLGKVNNLSIKDISLNLNDEVTLEGRIDTRNITDPDNTLINLEVKSLNTSMASLRNIIPNFNPPDNFSKLEKLDFSGRFDGFYTDFVAFGDMKTTLGGVTLDMRLDLKEGRDNAKYSGEINLNDFNLSEWSDNPDFGNVKFVSKVKEGNGLTLENAIANLDAEVEEFVFKGYKYTNFKIDGQLEKNRFDGDFKILNDDLDLSFIGSFQMKDSVYYSDFKADINKLDLKTINLSKDQFDIKGNIALQLEGSGIDDFIGEAELGDFVLSIADSLYVFDTLYVNSSPGGFRDRNVNVLSNDFSVSLNGDFNLEKVPDLLKWQIAHSYPYYGEQLDINVPENLTREQDFSFKMNIQDSKNYLNLLGADGFSIKNLTAKGRVDSKNELIRFESDIGIIKNKDKIAKGISLNILNIQDENKAHMTFDSLYAFNRKFDPIDLDLSMQGEIVKFAIIAKNLADSLSVLDINGTVSPHPDGSEITFDNKQLEMFSAEWNFSEDNSIVLGKDYLEIDNLTLSDGHRRIEVFDIRNEGVGFELKKFDFRLIDAFIDYDKIKFRGEGNVSTRIFNVFENPYLDMRTTIPQLFLNDIDYGEVNIDIHNDDSNIIGAVSILNENHNIKAFGTYNQENKSLGATLRARGFQMEFFEFIIDSGISDTQGYADVDVDISGPLNDLKMDGEGIIHNGGVKIDYLGNFIRFDNQRVGITENFLDLTDLEIIDTKDNIGIFTGGMHHDFLSDFVLELSVYSSEFIGLNTEKTDNPLYYGYGIGDITVDFTGPFSTTDILVSAITAPGTVLNIPVTSYSEGYEESFIHFFNKEDLLQTKDSLLVAEDEFQLEGVDIEMNLTITQAAKVNIIFNEQLNDIIKGVGEGNVRMLIKRTGEFDVFGDYEVFSGEYLFTAWGLVAKPFQVQRGGKVSWTGDPLDADIDLYAEYENLRAPLNVFLSEFQLSAQAQSELVQKTNVNLLMHLGGSLFEPIVNFDLSFPDLSGELKSYTDSKMATLRQNESELNNQVVGLLLFKSFLPSTSTIGSNIYSAENVFSSSYNTLSEFISNQLSFLLSGFLQEALSENGFVSGIDFEIGFSKNTFIGGANIPSANSNELTPDEVQANFKSRFFDDRWEVGVGGNYVRESPFGISDYVIGDFNIGYFLTADKRLKLRAYGKYDVDPFDQQREQKYGLGINYRKEFGSLIELKSAIKEDTKSFLNAGGSNE
jgi:hypothetical protein